MFPCFNMKNEIVLDSDPSDQRVWVPQPGAENVTFRPLLFDTANGVLANILRFRKKGVINKHRHHGTVNGYTIKGIWRYLEHDWIAKPGTYIHEPPGETHTLFSDSSEEVQVFSLFLGD